MNRIREARKRCGLTMKKLGEMVGASEASISLYETGKHEPSNKILVRIADALHVTVDYLLCHDELPADEDAQEQPTIGSRVQELRKKRGLSQEQLADLASLNRVTVAKYESGRIEPGAQALARIADALGVSLDCLMGREEKPDEKNADLLDTLWQLRQKPEMRALFSVASKAEPSHIRAAVAMMKALKESNDAD